MNDGRERTVLHYEAPGPPARAARVSPLAALAWVVFASLCVWFVWGMMEGLKVFYSPSGGPAASASWAHTVNSVGAGGATAGIILGWFALRNSAGSRRASLSALVINLLALILFGVLLALSLV